MKNKFLLVSLVGLVAVINAGCSLLAHNESQRAKIETFDSFQFHPLKLAAEDLSSAFLQIPQLDPRSTTLEVPRRTTEYGRALLDELSSAGYTIRKVDVPSGGKRLIYSESQTASADGGKFTARLGYKDVVLMRGYEERDSGLYPSTNLRVMGASAEIVLDDSMFTTQDARQIFPNTVEYVGGRTQVASLQQPVTTTVDTVVAVEEQAPVVEQTSLAVPETIEGGNQILSYKKLGGDISELENQYTLGESNFQETIDDLEPVIKQIIVFPNDSMRLGRKGKAQLREVADEFSRQTDYVSIVGCSHGNTSIKNGNEILAKGRVIRVADEYQRLGIDPDRILAEGCWAPVHFDEEFPRRAVVVNLFRKKGT